jgi:ubiquinone biosynthesis monooxygenase Coq7
MKNRHYSPVDHLLINLDNAVTTLFGRPQGSSRENPAEQQNMHELSDTENAHIAGLMRVNHTGEVCAQALYQGQALTAKLPRVRASMEQAAKEENDHLNWCDQRLNELDSHRSYLNPIWYAGSFALGATAGLFGDKWSLGFVAETEHQVVNHLQEHIQQVPQEDKRTYAILEQMKKDEAAHGTAAVAAGAAELPSPIKKLMTLTSKIMTTISYRI